MGYMSTETTYQIVCGELKDTLKLGEKIGKACIGGEVFELTSDLGGGKTAFVRGLASGMGIVDEVSSPSFTINNTYTGKGLVLEHFDFYRLDDAGVVGEQLGEDLFRKDTVAAIEWGDVVSDVLPADRIVVAITLGGDDARIFSFSYPPARAYLFRGIS